MVAIQTKDLTGAALDWAVAKCEGMQLHRNALLDGQVKEGWWVSGYYMDPNNWIPLSLLNFSTNWAQSGPIIEREGITVSKEDGGWSAYFRDNLFNDDGSEHWQTGPTPLIAAMRCFVASKLGAEVEVPEELAP